MDVDALVEAMARAIAPEMEGGREYDQMPPDRIALRKWAREGMVSYNDATQDDARCAARAALRAVVGPLMEDAAGVAEENWEYGMPSISYAKNIRARAAEIEGALSA